MKRAFLFFVLFIFFNAMMVPHNSVVLFLNKFNIKDLSLNIEDLKREIGVDDIGVFKENGNYIIKIAKRVSNYKERIDFSKNIYKLLEILKNKNLINVSLDEIKNISKLAKGGKVIFFVPKNCEINHEDWCYFNGRIKEEIVNGKRVFKRICEIPKGEWSSVDMNVKINFKDKCPNFFVTRGIGRKMR